MNRELLHWGTTFTVYWNCKNALGERDRVKARLIFCFLNSLRWLLHHYSRIYPCVQWKLFNHSQAAMDLNLNREKETERERGAILPSIQSTNGATKKPQRAMCTVRQKARTVLILFWRREGVTGEEERRCLDDFTVWLLSRFAGHSCFPARRPCSPSPVRVPCAASTATTALGSAQRSHC